MAKVIEFNDTAENRDVHDIDRGFDISLRARSNHSFIGIGLLQPMLAKKVYQLQSMREFTEFALTMTDFAPWLSITTGKSEKPSLNNLR
jgi:hypothetical protein